MEKTFWTDTVLKFLVYDHFVLFYHFLVSKKKKNAKSLEKSKTILRREVGPIKL